MSQYKLKSYKEHNEQINESVSLMLLLPVIAVVAGKLIGTAVAHFKGEEIRKSMDNLVKSRFADKAKDKDIKTLYDLIQDEYPKLLKALDKDDDVEFSNDLRRAGLDKQDAEELNQVISKLRSYHQNKA